MATADEIQQVLPELWVWQAYETAAKCDLSSTLLRVEGRLLLIDPIRLQPDALAELASLGTPELIILTNANHARAAAWFKERFGIPIAADAEATADLEVAPDQILQEGAILPGGVQVLRLPGAVAGEIALHSPNGVLCIGDALIHLEPLGFSLLPDKYCADPKRLRDSLRKLLPHPVRVLTFAHGVPIVERAQARLAALLA